MEKAFPAFVVALAASWLVSIAVGVALIASHAFLFVSLVSLCFGALTLIPFGIAYAYARAVRGIDYAAIAAVLIALLPFAPMLKEPTSLAHGLPGDAVQFSGSVLAAILVQWSLIRWRWCKTHPSANPAPS